MSIATEEPNAPTLTTSREPKGPIRSAIATIGDVALTDSLVLLLMGWVFLLVLAISLRKYNV